MGRQDKTGKIRTVRTTSKYPRQARPKLSTFGIVFVMSLTIAIVEAQTIYEGCGRAKKCLGFEKGRDDVQTSCLETQVIQQIFSIWVIKHSH